jgi:hypothetical protein
MDTLSTAKSELAISEAVLSLQGQGQGQVQGYITTNSQHVLVFSPISDY